MILFLIHCNNHLRAANIRYISIGSMSIAMVDTRTKIMVINEWNECVIHAVDVDLLYPEKQVINKGVILI